MFNVNLRKSQLEKLQSAVDRHGRSRESVTELSVRLFKSRTEVVTDVIGRVEEYVSGLANSPKHFDKAVSEYRVVVNRFDSNVQKLESEAARARTRGSAAGAAGTVAAAGVVTLAPTAAMAIATTFGVASTGTAISTLSGAAATSAALAWLGGGALTAGGAGMAGGKVILGLAGPIGWTIGGLALVGSGVYYNSKNKSIAMQATEDRTRIEAQIYSMEAAKVEIKDLLRRTRNYSNSCLKDLEWLNQNASSDYREFDSEDKQRLATLINNIEGVSKLLTEQVSL